MEIGAHTVRHPILASIPVDEAGRKSREGRDRRSSRSWVEPIDVFAYPNGKPDAITGAEHVALVRRLGFRGAVTTAPGVAAAGDDRFQIPATPGEFPWRLVGQAFDVKDAGFCAGEEDDPGRKQCEPVT